MYYIHLYITLAYPNNTNHNFNHCLQLLHCPADQFVQRRANHLHIMFGWVLKQDKLLCNTHWHKEHREEGLDIYYKQ